MSNGQSGANVSGAPRNARHCPTSALTMRRTTTAARTSCAAIQALLRRPSDGGSIDVGVASGNRLGGKGGERVETAGGAERGATIVTLEQRDQCGRQRGGVDVGNEDAGSIL